MKRCYCHVALKRVRQINPYPVFSPFEIHINSLVNSIGDNNVYVYQYPHHSIPYQKIYGTKQGKVFYFYRPKTKLLEGNIFTHVCATWMQTPGQKVCISPPLSQEALHSVDLKQQFAVKIAKILWEFNSSPLAKCMEIRLQFIDTVQMITSDKM